MSEQCDIEQITRWPRGSWSPQENRRVIEHRAHLHRELLALADRAERAERNLTAEEAGKFEALQAEYDRLA